MSSQLDLKTWWLLHLRKARGEALSEAEQQLYQTELARQDREAAPLFCDIETLKLMRAQAANLVQTNAELRSRVSKLEKEIESVENSLNDDTRAALGVKG